MKAPVQAHFRNMVFRPHGAPSPNIPLGARSVGHYRIRPSDPEKPQIKHFVQVFWCVDGAGRLIIGGEERRLEVEQIAIYLPGMRHNLQAVTDFWEYRWWTMDGPLAADILRTFGLTADIYRVGPAPGNLFDDLTRAIRDISPGGERRASALAYQLLSHVSASGRSGSDSPVISQALRTIHREVADPLFGIERLAAVLHLHRSTLSRQFKQAVGISPLDYLTRLRVQNALSLLKESTLSIAEIARQCGYDDPNYFSRLVHRHTGHSPLQFRKR